MRYHGSATNTKRANFIAKWQAKPRILCLLVYMHAHYLKNKARCLGPAPTALRVIVIELLPTSLRGAGQFADDTLAERLAAVR